MDMPVSQLPPAQASSPCSPVCPALPARGRESQAGAQVPPRDSTGPGRGDAGLTRHFLSACWALSVLPALRSLVPAL